MIAVQQTMLDLSFLGLFTCLPFWYITLKKSVKSGALLGYVTATLTFVYAMQILAIWFPAF